jgi:hypothetical protein
MPGESRAFLFCMADFVTVLHTQPVIAVEAGDDRYGSRGLE